MILALFTVLTSGAIAADPPADQDYTIDIERFRPASDTFGYGTTHSATTLQHLQLGVGTWFNYSNDPVVLVWEGERVLGDDEASDGIINDRLMGELQLGMGISPYFSISIGAPVVMHQTGFDPGSADNPKLLNTDITASGMTDLRVTPKLALVDLDKFPVGLAVFSEMTIPVNDGGGFLSEEEMTGTAMVAIEAADRSVRRREYVFRVAVNAGAKFRKIARYRDLLVENEFIYAGAVALHPVKPLEFGAEVVGSIGGEREAHKPLEVLPFIKLHAHGNVVVNAGGGIGVLPGLGTPDYRAFVGASFAPILDPAERDSDRDGIANKFDICPKDPEDSDEFQDDDGCPDFDNDKDGILDVDDLCMYEPEDIDGFKDEDGCPDTDNDKDQILDVNDQCPDNPENINEFQDDDGCPDELPIYDTDGDGYLDDVDRCPYDPEDFDGVEDEDGCPDEDQMVYIERNYIVIRDKIHFETNKAIIREVSYELMQNIAKVIGEHPEITLLRIEGHTDNKGDELYNIRLSQNRAKSVKQFLVNLGVGGDRLDAAGFGEARPITTNDTDEGRATNRRVEFLIVERDQ